MDLSQITPLIITFNEEANIGRVLERLHWARSVVIIDSGSTDKTLEIAARFPQVQVITRAFDSFASQCNFGLTQIKTPWVLSLDADYVLGDGFEAELARVGDDASGYRAQFRYCVHGRALRASLYPPRTVLHLSSAANYMAEGHGHRVELSGEVRRLQSVILHDDRKSLGRWLNAQIQYSRQEAEHLLTPPQSGLNRADRIRRMVFVAPTLVFFYTLLWRGLIFDGLAGWHYTLQRTLAELMLALQILDRKLRKN